MSWIGGLNNSLNQLTSKAGQIGGQLSSFTKEVLSEGTDEVIDYEAEAKTLRIKLIEAEAVISENEAQIAKQKHNISTLEERCRKSELEVHSCVCQYEAKLREQNKLISTLKNEEPSGNQEDYEVISRKDLLGSRRTFSGGSQDAADYADVITSQREVNRLSEELELLREERDYWKNRAHPSQETATDGDEPVQAKITELEIRLRETIDHHQHEYLALQQANAATVQRLQEENRLLRAQTSGSDNEGVAEEKSLLSSHSHKHQLTSLKSEVEELKEKLRTRSRQLQVQKKNIEELRSEVDARKDELHQRNEEIKNLRSEQAVLREDVFAKTNELQNISDGILELVTSEGSITNDSYESIIDHVKRLRASRDHHRDAYVRLQKEMAERELESMRVTHPDLDQLQMESLGQLVDVEEESSRKQADGSPGDIPNSIPLHLMQPLHQSSPHASRRSRPEDTEENFLIISPSHIKKDNQDGDLTLTLQALQKQVEDYELEIAQYEQVQREWQEEKRSLQDVLDRYEREQTRFSSKSEGSHNEVDARAIALTELKREIVELQEARRSMEKDKIKLIQEKEQLQNAVTNLQDELNMSITEAQTERENMDTLKSDLENAVKEKSKLQELLKNVSDELNASRVEKEELDEAIETLDQQHQEEMRHVLEIRQNLEQQLKQSGTEMEKIQKENEVQASKNDHLLNQLNSLKRSLDSDESGLTRAKEDLAHLLDEKKSMDEELQSARKTILELELQVAQSQEMMLNAEMAAESLKSSLDTAKKDRKVAEEQWIILEKENGELISSLQQQVQENSKALQDSASMLDDLEDQKNRSELEQRSTVVEMKNLEAEHKVVIEQLEAFRESQRKSDEELMLLTARKDEQLNKLNLELELLKEEDRKRILQLTQQSDSEAHEITSLKTALSHAHERLSSINSERQGLETKLENAESKVAKLKKDLNLKSEEVAALSGQLDSVKNDVVVKVQETVNEYHTKMDDLKRDHEAKLAQVKTNHQEEALQFRQDLESEMDRLLLQEKEKRQAIVDDRESLQHQYSQLQERVRLIELDSGAEIESLQEKLHQSDSQHLEEKWDLKQGNDHLMKELNRKRTLIESLEEEVKRLMEMQKDASTKNQQEFSHLHSEVMNEKSLLQSAFDEERETLREEHVKELAKIKLDFSDKARKLQDDHAEEIAHTISELKAAHKTDMAKLKTLLAEAEDDLTQTKEELASSQSYVKSIQDSLEKQERKWQEEMSSALASLRASHEDELNKQRMENDELLQRALDPDSRSINNELFDSQLVDLQNHNEILRAKLDEATHKAETAESTHAYETTKNLNEISSLRKKIEETTQENDTLEKHVTELKADRRHAATGSDNSALNHEAEIKELKTELEALKLWSNRETEPLQGATTTSSYIPALLDQIKSRDLREVEKIDLSKEDISSLLSLVKERDDVINVLHEKNNILSEQIKSKSSSDADEHLKRLREDKEQMLSVISDKTKENRQLKEEVHKMVDVIAAGKSALAKLQDENKTLIAKYQGFDQEMTKETVTRLSKLISEKDLEIESLKQKCQTLLDVLHQQEQRQGTSTEENNSIQSSFSAQQIQALLKDRETLAQQVRQLLMERDHLVALVNSKHQEAVTFQEEARKAAEALEKDAANNSTLQISYSNLVHDYEQLEMRLQTVQKELPRFKEAINHLEESKEILLAKMDVESSGVSVKKSRIADEMENLRSDSSKSIHGKSKEEMEVMLEKNNESLLQKDILLQESMDRSCAKEKQIEQMQKDLKEKDILIHQKMENTSQLASDLKHKANEVVILRKSVENLREQVSSSGTEAESLRSRLRDVERLANEKESESQAFQETNAQLSVMLKEREYELEALREKVSSLNDLLKRHEQGKDYESRKCLDELDKAKEQTTAVKHERDQIMLTLKQKQLETQRATEEARQLREKESKLQSELDRLRGHLVQVEETYTQEALLSSEREQALRKKLEQIKSRNASAVEANQLSKQQVESLQEQIRSASQQRDQAIHNYQLAQEQSSQYAAGLHQLQIAAERMQREEAATYAARVDKINQQYQTKVRETESLVEHVSELKNKLEEANTALESASRLNEQLESKEQTIDQLKQLVSEKQLQLEEIRDDLHKLNARSNSMVDRQLIKNLLIGYFNSPANKQPDVIRLISSVIGFSKEEESKLHPSKKGWVSGWLPWGRGDPSVPATSKPRQPQHHTDKLNESFTGMFVKFLEEESVAKQPLAKLPAAAMVNEAQQRMTQRKIAAEGIPTPAFNPPHEAHSSAAQERSTVAGRYNPFLLATSHAAGTPVSTGPPSHPLMQPLGSMLPTFTPVANAKPTAERDLLQGILQNENQPS